jgi:hypothetical protein
MQTWLAYSVFSSPPQEHPPAQLPVSRLQVSVLQGSQASALLIFYASDGTRAWVGAPAPTPAPPPNDQKWIRAPKPAETIAAFAGHMAPICVASATTTVPSTPTTSGVATGPTGPSSGNGTPWILIIVGVLVLAAGAVATSRVRGRRTA